jgi:hypothetical protein
VKVGDLVRHNGGGGESPAIGIIIREYPEYGYWKVLELCGEYIGCTSDADGTPSDGWYVISEMPLTDDDRPDTLRE